MTEILEGQRFWKHGDHDHVWIVDAVMSGDSRRPPFAILMREDGRTVEDVDLSHLKNPNLYTPVPEEAAAGRTKAG